MGDYSYDPFGIDLLRQQNMFDQYGGDVGYNPINQDYSAPMQMDQGYNPPSPPIMNQPVMDPRQPNLSGPSYDELMSMVNKAYTPDTTARDRFNNLLNSFPERNEPSFARRLVAGGMGLDARAAKQNPLATMEGVMYAPYMRDVSAWKEQAGPDYQALQAENAANVNERNLAANILNAKTQGDRWAAQANYQNERNRIAEEKVSSQHEIGLIRANAYKAKNEGATVKIDPGSGQVVATWPTGKVEYLGKVPGSSTAAELADIRGSWAVEAAKTRGEATLGAAKIHAGATLGAAGMRAGGKPMTAAERQARLREIYDTSDANSQKFFNITPSGTVSLKAKPTVGEKDEDGNEYTYEDIQNYTDLLRVAYPDREIGVTKSSKRGDIDVNAPAVAAPAAPKEAGQRSVTKMEYSPSRNATRITYSDGTTQIVQGRR